LRKSRWLVLAASAARTLLVVASELSQLGLDTPWGILDASVIVLSLPPLMVLGAHERLAELFECSA
jgi:multiple sugar transport system permease protein